MQDIEKIKKGKLKIQLHVVEHCNLNCKSCYHFSPLAEEEYLDIGEYERDMKRLSELFGNEMDEILLLGGEPLLHPQISMFFSITRKYFPVGHLKILTNGILLPSMSDEFWVACVKERAEIWVTKYPISVEYDAIEELASRKGSEVFYFSNEPIKTLGYQPIDVNGPYNYTKNFKECYRANECIMLDHGKMYTCIIPAVIRHFNSYFHKNVSVCEKDYIDIYNATSGEDILERLTQPIPFCRYCNRELARLNGDTWRTTKREIHEWT